MSGGAKNLYVYNCSFLGTDIGLRFKTTRGRSGIVENIYINNINMKDIAAEAILFDMYYAAKDPVPLAGEKENLQKWKHYQLLKKRLSSKIFISITLFVTERKRQFL